eukprot:11791-Heterococcus_DN1.PRE.2
MLQHVLCHSEEEQAAEAELAAKIVALRDSDPEAFAQLMQAAAAGNEGLLRAATGEIGLPNGAVLGAGGVQPSQPTKGIQMLPQAAFVVKTKDMSTGAKQHATSADSLAAAKKCCTSAITSVLLNEIIGIPGPKKRLDEQGNEVEVHNVPISVGPARPQTDKAGVSNVQEDRSGASRDCLCQLAREYVERKANCKLDERYKLPRMSIEPAAQMVRDERSVPTIQEVTSTTSSSKQGPSVTPKRPPQPLKYWIQGRHKAGELSDMTELDIVSGLVREACSAQALQQAAVLKLSPFEVSIAVEGHHSTDSALYHIVHTTAHATHTQHSISTLLPYGILVDSVTARVDPHLRVLTVTATVDVTPFDVSADPGSKPWLLAQALNDGTDRSSSSSSSNDKKLQKSTPEAYASA